MTRYTDALKRTMPRLLDDVGIDMGTRNSLVYAKGRGVIPVRYAEDSADSDQADPDSEIYQMPSFVTCERTNHRDITGIGLEAFETLGLESFDIEVLRPVKCGRIHDDKGYAAIMQELLSCTNKHYAWKKFISASPTIVVGIPYNASQVEVTAIQNIIKRLGGTPRPVSEAVLAALGANLNLDENRAHAIIDIGGGTTDIGIVMRRRVLFHDSIAIGGDDIDLAIISHLRTKRGLKIGLRTAEWIKKNLGGIAGAAPDKHATIRGRCTTTQQVIETNITGEEVSTYLRPTLECMLQGVTKMVQEIRGDQVPYFLKTYGIALTGGTSKLPGLAKFLSQGVEIDLYPVAHPFRSVIDGAGKLVENQDLLAQFDWARTLDTTRSSFQN